MAELTPIERVRRFFNHEPVDKMPFFTGMGMVLLPAIKKLGYKFPSVHRNAEKMALSSIESARMFNLDSVVIPYDMCMESEALGNEISLYEDSEDILYPTIPYKSWAELDQVEISQDDIDNAIEKYPLNILPEAIKIIKKEAPDLAVGAWELGPFTQCGQTIELDKVLKGVFKHKERVEDILDKFSDMIINIGKALQEAGADFITLREPGVAADLLSPRTFKEMIQPRLTRILSAWNSPKVLHICGSTDSLVDMMWQVVQDSGGQAISFDIKNNLLETRKKLGNNALIVGNFDVFKLPCAEETTVEQAIEGIKTNIDGLVDAVWPGCDLWPDIKEENFRAMEKTVREYKTGPTPAVGRM
ncbi:MAG: methyltransferase [Proteobacteria bacterium]|nr:methyltransferase [Pseudomonadota bacterium]MBU0990202.1 methyltransferase [Pseudomonadota bacterium]MBU1904891.1 methyltransferase [Pseudomonadota bacterium]